VSVKGGLPHQQDADALYVLPQVVLVVLIL
jgi:hypothetical protein